MCGIVGCIGKGETNNLLEATRKAASLLSKRGPDFQSAKQVSPNVVLGHARLSIIDTSSVAHQPMQDKSGRYTIVFNGEIFNYRELRDRFLSDKKFTSESDTEVLLQLYILLGLDCLKHLNGFFAFAIHDNVTNETFIARDRLGIKPLHVCRSNGLVVFASELKAILSFPIAKEIDYSSLLLYLQLNYLPEEHSMLKGIVRVLPGNYVLINADGKVEVNSYYQIPFVPGQIIQDKGLNYSESKAKLKGLVEEAVIRRLVSDVPLGCFLSGGIDSSIVTACASREIENLNTFSIGYADEPFYDETKYANLVARKFRTNHTVFSVSADEMFSHIYDVLDYIDEPFADSSAIAVYILSKKTRQKVTVALSGDGGDELFAGYNKHHAEARARKNNIANYLIRAANPLLNLLPQSRNSKITNTFRQIKRYSDGLKYNNPERYWRWCVFQGAEEARGMMKTGNLQLTDEAESRADRIRSLVTSGGDINDVLLADAKMVLPGDMLTKVDLMSMANSLEVRVPLLDYTVVNFAFSLPVSFKIKNGSGKFILKDAFRDVLPLELYSRPKHGFEVPISKWIKTGLRSLVEEDLLSDKFVEEQGIFNPSAIKRIRTLALSDNPGDFPAIVWGLVVFQYWYRKYFLN